MKNMDRHPEMTQMMGEPAPAGLVSNQRLKPVSIQLRRAVPPHDQRPFARFHQRILEKAADRSRQPVLIVALGDSVTQGLAEPDRFLHDQVYHAHLKRLLEQRHPLCTFSVINAGADGQTAADGLARFDRDVAAHQPDLLLIAFGLNDAALGGLEGVDQFARSLETLIERTRSQTDAEIVLLTPNMMLTRDNDAIPHRYRHFAHILLRVQTSGALAQYARRIREIAQFQQVAVADVYREWEILASRGIDTTTMLSNGLNHPNEEGHRHAGEAILSVL
jgi:lysophospholipase L1-like esterase